MKRAAYSGSFHGVERKKLGFKFLPSPDHYDKPIATDHCLLITNDGSSLTESVFQKFNASSARIVVLNLPIIKGNSYPNGYTLSSNTNENIQEVLEKIKSENGPISNFIHLHPNFTFSGRNFAQHYQTEKEITKSVFLLAKNLQAGLNEIGETDYARFLTVSQMDGFLGKGNKSNTSVFGGGLTGLVKCLNLEWSSVFCRSVDMALAIDSNTKAEHIYNEFFDANRDIIEVAYDEQIRKTTEETSVHADENTPLQSNINADTVALVSGGAKGVTATCVLAMSKAFQNKFILLGRSDIQFDLPAYAKANLDERALKAEILTDLKNKGEKASLPLVKKTYSRIISKIEIESTLQQLRANGSEVIYIKGDVTNPESFSKELKIAEAQLGITTCIIHGAGRLADKYIQDKTAQDFENVLSVKLDGMLSLLSVVDINKIENLVLFSSVAGYYGNVGQTDYAIANEILSKAAHLFKTNHPNVHVSAINWGAWDSGMVSGELKAQFEAMGVKLVNSDGGAAMFLNELNTQYANEPSMIIGGTLPAGISHLGKIKTHRIYRTINPQENPFLQDHVIQGNPVLPVVNAVGWMAQSCEKLYPDFRVFEISDTKLYKGLVFDHNESIKYTLLLEEQLKTEEAIIFKATVQSKGKKLPAIHYKANIQIRHKRAIPTSPTFNLNIDTASAEEGSVLYQNGALFHGPSFRGIEQIISYNEKEMVLSCKAPFVEESIQGQFPVRSVNTFFSDIQYQGMVVWVQRFNQGAKSLPLQTDRVTLFSPLPFDQKMYVHISIKESSEFKMVADCTVMDENGKVFMKTEGAAVTVSKQLQW